MIYITIMLFFYFLDLSYQNEEYRKALGEAVFTINNKRKPPALAWG